MQKAGAVVLAGGVMRVRALVVGYLMVVAFLLGMVVEKARFGARRDAVMARYERALAQWRETQMRSERATGVAERYGTRGGPQPDPLAAPIDGSVLPPGDR